MLAMHEIALRLMLTAVLCGAIGLERALTGKVAGIRTHILVGLGAAIFTLVSGYAFGTHGVANDRIAAQVVSGIGFVAGGVILKERGAVRGITTAAGLWVVAAIGMAVGAGLYPLGGLGAAVVLLTLVLLRFVEEQLPRRRLQTWQLDLTLPAEAACGHVQEALARCCHKVWLISLRAGDTQRITFGIEVPRDQDIGELLPELRAQGALSLTLRATQELEQ